MGIIVISLAVIALSVYLLAIITDEFFVVSLDQISNKLNLPSSVAGASLMAMGSSAPELAIAILALFKEGGAHSDLGIGTIVGSAIFNILVIIGVSAIARPTPTTRQVITRDVSMYLACIALLFITFWDGTITIIEATSFLVLYGVYLYILFTSSTRKQNARRVFVNFCSATPTDQQVNLEKNIQEKVADTSAPAEGPVRIYHMFTDLVAKGMGIFMGDAEKNYIRTFVVSILFIGIISWFLVEYAVLLAGALGIPPIIIALTILAGGTSVPDLIASVIVAKQGRGDMAIANAVGSNVFDILIALGVPWLIVLLWRGDVVHVGTTGLLSSIIILLGTVILLVYFMMTQCRLSRREGWGLVSAYGLYVVWTWIGG